DAKKLVKEEASAEGHVKWTIYLVYASAVGGILFWFFLILAFILTRTIEVSESLWIREWVNSYDDLSLFTRSFFTRTVSSTSSLIYPMAASSSFFDLSTYLNYQEQYTESGYLNSASAFTTIQKEKHSTDYYLAIYVLISVLASLAHILQTVIVLYGSLRAA